MPEAVEESPLFFSTASAMRILISLILCLAVAGCSGKDHSACPAGNLGTFARDQALRGLPASLPGAGCVLDAAEQAVYDQGRAAGLARYCSAAHGYALAIDAKKSDASVCDEATAKEHKRGFEIGDNLRQHLDAHASLLKQAADAERIAVTLEPGLPARAALEREAATLKLEARAKQNDIEALRGIVAIEKWR